MSAARKMSGLWILFRALRGRGWWWVVRSTRWRRRGRGWGDGAARRPLARLVLRLWVVGGGVDRLGILCTDVLGDGAAERSLGFVVVSTFAVVLLKSQPAVASK